MFMNATINTSLLSATSEGGATPHPSSRCCSVCGIEIPRKRLEAKPNATECVPCLEGKGDVPTYKRFDEYVGSLETSIDVVSTLYKQPNRHILNAQKAERIRLSRLGVTRHTLPRSQRFNSDEFLARDGNGPYQIQ